MEISRRTLLRTGLETGALLTTASMLPEAAAQPQRDLPPALEALKPIRYPIRPITPRSFRAASSSRSA